MKVKSIQKDENGNISVTLLSGFFKKKEVTKSVILVHSWYHYGSSGSFVGLKLDRILSNYVDIIGLNEQIEIK